MLDGPRRRRLPVPARVLAGRRGGRVRRRRPAGRLDRQLRRRRRLRHRDPHDRRLRRAREGPLRRRQAAPAAARSRRSPPGRVAGRRRAHPGRDARRRRDARRGRDQGGGGRQLARADAHTGQCSKEGQVEGMEPPEHQGMLAVDSVDVSNRDDVHHLHGGAVGLAGVLFLTVTGAAPISAMLFNTPLSVGYGNGIGTPAGFAFATVILTIFSVGYVAMARKVTAAGGFYSFISHGLGRELGMAAGLAMVVAYSVFEASLCGGFAYFASLKAAQYGYNIEWYWLALFMVALIGVLAYFDIHISARLLGIALISEVLFLLIFDVVIFGQGGENVQAA